MLSIFFLLLGFRQWRSRADRVLTLNMNIRQYSDFHCFGALGGGPGARTWPHVRAWRIGVIIVIVEPPKKCHKSAWPMNCKKYLKKGGNCEGFSTLIPQTALALRAAAYRGNKISTSCVRPVARWRRNMPRSLAALSKSQHLVPRMQGHLVC